MSEYLNFLSSKIKVTEQSGFKADASDLHPSTKPHQRDAILWALQLGKAGIFKKFGLGKTHDQIEFHRLIHNKEGGKHLVVAPIGTLQEFTDNDGPRLGVEWRYIEEQSDITDDHHFYITNYDRIRLCKFDLTGFVSVSLDEGSVLRNIGSDTTEELTRQCAGIPYRLVATATPAPNDYLELINYAHFLGVMDRGQALTRFFKRNSLEAGNLTLCEGHEDDFWLWVMSWGFFLSRPSILGYSDEGYAMPELEVNLHCVDVDRDKFGDVKDKFGRLHLFADGVKGLGQEAKVKRVSINERMARVKELVDSRDEHCIIWHTLEDERKLILKHVPHALDVHGTMDKQLRKERILGFARGEFPILATKPEISGSGCNFQHHCSWNIFMGINHKFEDFIQAIHRTLRFLQQFKVTVDIVYCKEEQHVLDDLMAKWRAYDEMQAKMDELILKYGIDQRLYIETLKRTFACERQEINGNDFTYINNDNVQEFEKIDSNRFGLLFTSIPFGNHYEYTHLYNDFGHNENDEKFFQQMDYLTPHVFRTLQPGRNLVVHVKDRILYGYQNGLKMYTVNPFSDKTVAHYIRHGFAFMGRRTVKTDVVRENNQTYRLGYSECCKDSSNKGSGSCEYLLLFRKPQTSRSNSYADVPITHDKKEYSLSAWQIDADGVWRSSGNRLVSPHDLIGWGHKKIMAWWKERNLTSVYDYEQHVEYCKALQDAKQLPKSFSLMPVQNYDEDIWTDVNYMLGLNAEQIKRGAEAHICPLPFDIVDRVIELYSNKGDEVGDFFGGLGTVPLRAMKKGRKGFGVELNPEYYKCATVYLQEEEAKQNLPTLFDCLIE
ncbi:DNA methyltransferase [Pinibacter soli]|uniref:DNA methyltransferase n=1 Tax=Pinibacter soli TaxID=3044211 RepID=A0ABT6RBM1_9BACT|nr:DNA methyltransferase [Pinibacter soli]MDI3319974.1 DNA methyltransferase [Pinibacter soli]